MLNSPVINFVVLLAVTFFIGSLLVSSINVVIAGTRASVDFYLATYGGAIEQPRSLS